MKKLKKMAKSIRATYEPPCIRTQMEGSPALSVEGTHIRPWDIRRPVPTGISKCLVVEEIKAFFFRSESSQPL